AAAIIFAVEWGTEADSDDLGLQHPRRDIALAVQHPPDINVLRTLDVEHELRIAHKRPETQAGQVQLMGVAGRPSSRMVSDVRISLLQGVNEAERSLFSTFTEIVGNRVVDVPVGQFAGNDGLGRHPRAPTLATLRTRSRSPLK